MRREASRIWLPGICSLLSAAFVVIGAPAAKAQVCVDPDKSGCFPTIQQGIEAASPGQKVDIGKGEYFENVVIDKVALRVRGSGQGKTIVRGSPGLPTFTLANEDISLQRMTIRGGNNAQGVSIPAGSTGVLLEKVDVIDVQNGACILSQADQTFIRDSKIGNCGGACIATGIGVSVKQTEITKSEIGPCAVAGLRAGLFLTSTSSEMFIDKNEFFRTGGACIDVNGPMNTITRNDLEQCENSGIASIGDDPVIERNDIEGTEGPGIFQNCFGGCTRGSISKNDIEATGGPGISVEGGGDGTLEFVVERNGVENSGETGVRLEGGGLAARKNSVKRSGQDGADHCFEIIGSNNLLESNTGDRCTGNGFLVNGSENNLNENKGNRNFKDGFEVANNTLDNVLSENSAKDNGIYGFEIFGFQIEGSKIGAVNTVLNDDKAKNNQRGDLCDAGVNTTINGGKYKVIAEERTDPDLPFLALSCFQY